MEWTDFYVGGAPPLAAFSGTVEEIKRLASSLKQEANNRQVLLELCLIGLAAHFEAYCKAHFAAIINIYPAILEGFIERRGECSLPVADLLEVMPRISRSIGSMLREKYDFGSAKQVNSLLSDLLGITPFSKDEMKRYSEFLRDRNLLVHDGGVFTFKYQQQKLTWKRRAGTTHQDALVIDRQEIEKWAAFLFGIAQKIANRSQEVLEKRIESHGVQLSNEHAIAITLLNVT